MTRATISRLVLVLVFATAAFGCSTRQPSASPSQANASPGSSLSSNPSTTVSHSPAPPSEAASAAPSETPPSRDPAAYVEGQPYPVTVNAADFVAVVDNPYFPLTPGTTYVFEGSGEHNEVAVTHDTKTILGVTTIVVHDQVLRNGKLYEDTLDWYAQDRWGNVWYFGEATGLVENGVVTSTQGSWEAGVDGALPGIVMLAEPQVGDVYRQEYYLGRAEDVGKVIAIGGSVSVPHATYDSIIVTEDWSLLTAGGVEEKTYAPGVGFVRERLAGSSAVASELVDIRTGG
jgi:hypothetical protein